MKSLNKIMVWVPGLIVLIINLILYNSLPDKVGMQLQISGDLGNYVPKVIFVIGLPVLMFVLSYYIDVKKSRIVSLILVNIIIIAAEIFILIANL